MKKFKCSVYFPDYEIEAGDFFFIHSEPYYIEFHFVARVKSYEDVNNSVEYEIIEKEISCFTPDMRPAPEKEPDAERIALSWLGKTFNYYFIQEEAEEYERIQSVCYR